MTTELINTISSGFSQVVDYSLSSLNVVLPIALGIFMIMFVWIFAKKFFNKLVGNKESVKRDDELHEDDDYDDDDD